MSSIYLSENPVQSASNIIDRIKEIENFLSSYETIVGINDERKTKSILNLKITVGDRYSGVNIDSNSEMYSNVVSDIINQLESELVILIKALKSIDFKKVMRGRE